MSHLPSSGGFALPVGALSAAFLLAIGIALLVWHGQSSTCRTFDYVRPREISAQERDGFVQETEPMSVIVHFIDPAMIRKRTGPLTISYATPYTNPCEIFLPTGMKIIAVPRQQHAYFARTEDDNSIAHEFLHCIRGNWHAGPS